MSKKKFSAPHFEGGDLVVKNKKFKKGDVLAFGLCIIAALIIWIYATNHEIEDQKRLEELHEPPHSEQTTEA